MALLVWLCLACLCAVVYGQYPFDTVLRIDCGGYNNFTSKFNLSWMSDRFFTGGAPGLVSEPHNFVQEQERTLRFFPIAMGKKNCYIVNVPDGRYYIRTFFVYDNYDSRKHSPSFEVSVEGTLVFSWRSPWLEENAKFGAYSDLFAFIKDGEATVCLYSIATDAPVIGSLEIIQVDPLSYASPSIGKDVILVNYGRLTCGSPSFGPGFSNDTDNFGRAWQSDINFVNSLDGRKVLSTQNLIKSTNQAHDYFPVHLYQTARTLISNGHLEYHLPVDTRLDYMLWFHFAEIDPSINAAGQRVFDIIINDINLHQIDIFKEVGSFTAFRWQHIAHNLTKPTISIKLVPVTGTPVISGLENYALISMDLATETPEVVAMRALKESFQIPDRMGWNGDPCAPSTWDAWEGVTCNYNKDSSALVITHLDLGSQGLKGFISDKITTLSNLVSLNLSYNSLRGTIPLGLGHASLRKVDLSNNQLTGMIPDSLGSSQLKLVLLNDNEMEGRVPEDLYSIGVRGGTINLSGNLDLCGVPSLPDCPIFWEKGGLTAGAKIVRSTRYQKHKNKMVFESETQNMNSVPTAYGFASNLNPL
ncbi:receptor-like protein 4 isoform X2 [Cryptomeria japonica]|uniref:receptor-like protein 4 isoform X2 n=1 Tax=Cryptomeria japonica TaxID=3369 RepID=UPI0027DA55D3|nr:receptor-like protein 4 isoform X2 [Cryptomeria japonica]